MYGLLYYLLIPLFVLVAFLLMVVILIQKGRGGGIASAFGGAGGSTAFGSKTGDVLTWVTASMFGMFLLLAIFISVAASSIHDTAEAGKPGTSAPKTASPAATLPPAGTTGEPVAVPPSTQSAAATPSTAPASQP